jgi:hypothetical protein
VKVGTPKIEADVRPGSRRDAVLFSAGANASHGLRRTNDDKRRAVLILLDDAEWGAWSDREIARRCGVDNKTVSSLRARPSEEVPQIRTVERNGTTYQQNTAAIGKSSQVEETSPPSVVVSDSEEFETVRNVIDIDDDEITAADLENDPGFQKAVESLANAKALADEVAAMPTKEPLTPEQEAHYRRAFGSPEDRQNFMTIVRATEFVRDLPPPEQMVTNVPPTLDHAVDVIAILAVSKWFENFARAWERRKGAAA